MPHYRRHYLAGGTYFFTVVTAGRRHIFRHPKARALLRNAIQSEQARRPFEIEAFVLLPDHLHTIWTLPGDDADYSTRWSHIKGSFTHTWIAQGGEEARVHAGQSDKRRRGIWQPRFHEHTIRDEHDFEAHVDYIHFNPVKHGYVKSPAAWKWSSLHRYIAKGLYAQDWGGHTNSTHHDFNDHE